MLEHAYLIPLLPLAASLLILFFGKRLPLEGAFLGILAAGWGLIQSIAILVSIYVHPELLTNAGASGPFFEMSWDWFSVGFTRLEVGVLIDGMSAMMLAVVTLVSLLVQIYSVGYQHGKERFGRFFAYLSFFTAAMLILVVSNNLFQFFMGWELMGLCSYLLIGFEFERPAAAYAGRKAFITTRIGDLGFYLGLLLLFTTTGSLNFNIIGSEHLGTLAPVATLIALLLLCGTIGKSAQVPLHVWLPDAMEGPTPVSALIHAATMVAAGVFLLARFHFVFALSEMALTVTAWVGGITALGAALSALTATDIKKVLAYSTISQLGFMVLGMGVGDPTAGLFHLTTHAYFKALLFLGAGSVIHAVHTNEMPLMGGLAKKLVFTSITMGVAWLAIIGFPFTSGFYSKEAILGAVYNRHQYVLFGIAAFSAFLTTFYMTRMMILTFYGTPRDAHRFGHAHESGPSMTIPLMVLAVPSAFLGLLFHSHGLSFDKWVQLTGKAAEHTAHAAEAAAGHGGHYIVLGASLAAVSLGLVLSIAMYVFKTPDPARLAAALPGVYRLLNDRFFDPFYVKISEIFCFLPARFLSAFDYIVIDQGAVDGVGRLGGMLSRVHRWWDDVVVDGVFVNGLGWAAQKLGAGVRALQSGAAQAYLLATAVGVFALVLWAVGVFG